MGRSFSPACDLRSYETNGRTFLVWSLFQIVNGVSTQVYANGIPYVTPSFAAAEVFIQK
jgi:hypothetical protein